MENKLIPRSKSSLGFFGIIKESFKTTSKNKKLFIPILLLVFLSYSQLDFVEQYTLAPISNNFMLQLANNPNILHDLAYNIDQTHCVGPCNVFREILSIELLVIVISLIITLVFFVTMVCSSYDAYTNKVLGPKDILLKISRSWKRPIVTSFYLILLSFGVIFFYSIVIAVTFIFAVNSLGLLFLGVIALSIPVCYIYVTTLWIISLIVSVLEEGSGGFKAIGRGMELMKVKKLQASLMMVLFVIADCLVFVVARFVDAGCNWSLSLELAITIPITNGCYCLLKLFMFVMYTVFYHERKTSHEAKEENGFC